MSFFYKNCDIFLFNDYLYMFKNNELFFYKNKDFVKIDINNPIETIDYSSSIIVLKCKNSIVINKGDNKWKKQWVVDKELIDVFVKDEDIFFILKNNGNFEFKLLRNDNVYSYFPFIKNSKFEIVDKDELLFNQLEETVFTTNNNISVPIYFSIDYLFKYQINDKVMDVDYDIKKIFIESSRIEERKEISFDTYNKLKNNDLKIDDVVTIIYKTIDNSVNASLNNVNNVTSLTDFLYNN